MLLVPGLIIFVLMFSWCCCRSRIKNFFKRQTNSIFFNAIIQFVEGTLLTICVCCMINIYQVHNGTIKTNSSYYLALGLIATAGVYLVALIVYLNCKFSKLETEPVKIRVGAAYQNLAVSESGRSVLGYIFLSFGRRIALAVVITFG